MEIYRRNYINGVELNFLDFTIVLILIFFIRLAQQSIKALPSEVMEKVTVKSALWSKDEDQLLADISQV